MNKIVERMPLPIQPPAQVSPEAQLGVFLNKPVIVEYARDLQKVQGVLKSVTPLGMMVLRGDGRMKLIWMSTMVSIEEAKVDQSLMAS